MDVAVVGAGAAGLSAAWSLVQAGARVTLYERTARAGGKLRTETVGGARVDVGVQLVSSTYSTLFGLAEGAGARDLLRRSPGRDALWRKERPQAITYGSVASMVASAALPTTLKLKLAARYLPYLGSTARTLDANDPAGSGGAALDTESIAAWGRREVGDDFVELLVYPLLAAYYGMLPEETSAPMYHAIARVGMDVSLYGATGGFGALIDAIVTSLQDRGCRLVAESEVQAVRPDDTGRVVIECERGGTHDAVVIATPANRAAKLLGASDAVRTWLTRVRVRPTFTVAYRMEKPFPGDYFGLSFPRASAVGGTVAALCIQGNKLPGLVPPDGDALVALPAPTAVPELLAQSDAVITDRVLEALERAVSGIGKRVASAHVYRFEDGYTVFEPGHLKHIAAFDASLLPANIALAGDYLLAPTVEGAMRSGAHAAARVKARLSAGAG